MSIQLRLPFPPALNRYYRHVGPKVLISATGRAFRANALADITEQGSPRLKGPVSLTVDAYPPDRRRRDVDGMLKALGDALVHAQVIEDDSFIQRLTITKHPSEGKPGKAVVTIARWP